MRSFLGMSGNASRAVLYIYAVALLGCGAAPPELADQLRTVTSWTATLQLATAQHRASAIITRYATQLDEAAKRALDDARHSLPPAEHGAADARRAESALDSLDRAIRQLDAEDRL